MHQSSRSAQVLRPKTTKTLSGPENFSVFIKTRYLPVTTESRQECSPASNFPYIFHKKLQFFKKLFWNQIMPDFDIFFCSTIYDRVCHWLTVGRWVSPGTPVDSRDNDRVDCLCRTTRSTSFRAQVRGLIT
jgi:hypothetical protein